MDGAFIAVAEGGTHRSRWFDVDAGHESWNFLFLFLFTFLCGCLAPLVGHYMRCSATWEWYIVLVRVCG